jgi:DNA-3-methyladenine glycosylase II
VLDALVARVGPPRLRPPNSTNFAALTRSIVYQQLAGRAAAAIHARLLAACGGEPDPEQLLEMPEGELRAAGLSAAKTLALLDLAQHVVDGRLVLDPRRLARRSDEQIVDELSAVRGIGRWTAQMFLLFQLRRLDVWPTGDFGVRRGFSLAWRVDMPSPRQLEAAGEPFRPYRSLVAWYCWRACEVCVPGEPPLLGE